MGGENDVIRRAIAKILSYLRSYDIEEIEDLEEVIKKSIKEEDNIEALRVVLYALLFYPKRLIVDITKHRIEVFIPSTGETIKTTNVRLVEAVKELLKSGEITKVIKELKALGSPRYIYLA